MMPNRITQRPGKPNGISSRPMTLAAARSRAPVESVSSRDTGCLSLSLHRESTRYPTRHHPGQVAGGRIGQGLHELGNLIHRLGSEHHALEQWIPTVQDIDLVVQHPRNLRVRGVEIRQLDVGLAVVIHEIPQTEEGAVVTIGGGQLYVPKRR